MSKDNKKKNGVASFFVRILQGSLIGVGGILPGISGGVLCASRGAGKRTCDDELRHVSVCLSGLLFDA